jgi:TetR/AcrR family transcriptional repressor of nem operon
MLAAMNTPGAALPASRKQLTHDRIVETAARVLRETGFSGVGVADIMKRAGLTHGGFYAHFASREALVAEALQRAGEDSRARLDRSIKAGEAQGASRLRALVENYLSERHLKGPETGCPVAALASEIPRQAGAVRDEAGARVRSLVATVESVLPPGAPKEDAAIIAAQLVGALQIARALGDNAAGRRQLAQSRRFLVEQFDSSRPNSR